MQHGLRKFREGFEIFTFVHSFQQADFLFSMPKIRFPYSIQFFKKIIPVRYSFVPGRPCSNFLFFPSNIPISCIFIHQFFLTWGYDFLHTYVLVLNKVFFKFFRCKIVVNSI